MKILRCNSPSGYCNREEITIYTLEEVKEAEKKARDECHNINCEDCRISSLGAPAPCKTALVPTYLEHGTLRKAERDEGLIKALERVKSHVESIHPRFWEKELWIDLDDMYKKAKGEE